MLLFGCSQIEKPWRVRIPVRTINTNTPRVPAAAVHPGVCTDADTSAPSAAPKFTVPKRAAVPKVASKIHMSRCVYSDLTVGGVSGMDDSDSDCGDDATCMSGTSGLIQTRPTCTHLLHSAIGQLWPVVVRAARHRLSQQFLSQATSWSVT